MKITITDPHFPMGRLRNLFPRFIEMLEEIEYKESWQWVITIGPFGCMGFRVDILLGVSYNAVNTSANHEIVLLTHGGSSIPEYIEEFGESQMLRFAFDMIQRAEYHESREWFTYRGAMPYDPHKDERERGAT